jgi:hypothetical protein
MKGTNALIFLTALTIAGGCAGTPTEAAPPPTKVPSPTRAAEAVSPKDVANTATTAATSATHTPSVPPVPVVTGIRYAAHPGFDRIVLDIPGALPSYETRYVTQVTRDGSGEPVAMPGSAFLMIVLHPAQAHRDNGTPTVTGTHRTDLTRIQAYAVVGDYEGYVSIALGLNGKRSYHVAELSNRIYVDVPG